MRHKTKTRITETAKGVSLFGAIIVVFMLSMWAFPRIDCHNATMGLEFIELCEADENCELRQRDRELKGAYTRLKIKACPKQ